MDKRPVLMVGQTPPPFHGQAMVTQALFGHEWREFDVECLRMAYSRKSEEIGRVRFGKVGHLIGLVWKTWKSLLRRRGTVLYYPPAGPSTVPILRDIVYLLLTRPLAAGVVFHYHGGGLPEFLRERPLLRWLAKLAYRKALVSIEISSLGLLPGEFFAARSSALVRNGINVPPAKGGPGDRALGKKTRVLYVGGLTEGKGILDLVETARILKKRGQSAEFMIVGEWWDADVQAECERRIGEYGLTDAELRFTGSLSGDAKWGAYQSADIFFFPSHYDTENFPLVVIEAMGSGVPVVSTQWRGIPEIVDDGVSGILCPISDPEAFADALEKLITDLDARSEMGRTALAAYREGLTEEVFFDRMEQALGQAFELLER